MSNIKKTNSHGHSHGHRHSLLVACEPCLKSISPDKPPENAGRIEEEMGTEGLPRNWVGQDFRVCFIGEGHVPGFAAEFGMKVFRDGDVRTPSTSGLDVFCAHIPAPEGVGWAYVGGRRLDQEEIRRITAPAMGRHDDHHTSTPMISCGSCLMAADRRYGPLAPLDRIPTLDDYAAGHPGDWPPSWFGRDFRISAVHDSQAQNFIIGLGMKRARVKIFTNDPGTPASLLFCSHIPITVPS